MGADGVLAGVAGSGVVVGTEVGVRQADLGGTGPGDLVAAGTNRRTRRPGAALLVA